MDTRTFARASVIALALMLTSVMTLSGQTQVDAELAPFVGGNFYLADARAPFMISRGEGAQLIVEDGELRDAPAFGFSAGLRFADRVGVEGLFAWVPTRLVGAAAVPQRRRVADVNSLRYGVSALYHWDARGRFRPFAGLAVSSETMSYEPYATWERETETAGAVTVGAHIPMSDRLAVRMQAVQDVIGRADRGTREQLMLTLGLSYRQRVR